jgi:hypothetical protein
VVCSVLLRVLMNTIRAISTLAILTFGTVCVVGCGADTAPDEQKGKTTAHEMFEEEGSGTASADLTGSGEGEGDRVASTGTYSEEDDRDAERVANGDQQAAIPALVVIGIVTLGVAAICTTHNILCANAASNRCAGGQASVVSSCSGSLKNLVEVKCEISCPSSQG